MHKIRVFHAFLAKNGGFQPFLGGLSGPMKLFRLLPVGDRDNPMQERKHENEEPGRAISR
jgi:hypothetical protein